MPSLKPSTALSARPRRSSDAPAASQLPPPSSRFASSDGVAPPRRMFPALPPPQGAIGPHVRPSTALPRPPLPGSSRITPLASVPTPRPNSVALRPRAPSVTGLPPPRPQRDPFVPIVSATPRRIPSGPGIVMTEETLFHEDGRWADPIPGSTEAPPREFKNLTLRKVTEANGSVHHERIWKERRIGADGNIHDEFKTLKAGIIPDSDAGSLYRPDIAPGAGRESNLAMRWNGRGPYTYAMPTRPRAPSPSRGNQSRHRSMTPSSTTSSSSAATTSSTSPSTRFGAPSRAGTATPSTSPPSSVLNPSGMGGRNSSRMSASVTGQFTPGYVPLYDTIMSPPFPGYSRGRRDSISSNSSSSSRIGSGPLGNGPTSAGCGRPMSRGYGR